MIVAAIVTALLTVLGWLVIDEHRRNARRPSRRQVARTIRAAEHYLAACAAARDVVGGTCPQCRGTGTPGGCVDCGKDVAL